MPLTPARRFDFRLPKRVFGRVQGARRRAGRPATAFVLSGGGNLGAIQVGMLRALHEHGIKPDVIVGCSVGAINAAAFAAEPGLRGIQRLERLWANLARGEPDLMPNKRFRPTLMELSRKAESMHDPDILREFLRAELPVATFSELQVPFACIATDAATAGAHWFSSGSILDALMASAALPAVYPPVEVDGRQFYDGGVVTELPAQWAVDWGATDLYILQVGHLDNRPLEITRPFDGLMHAYWAARLRRLEDDLERLRQTHHVIRLPAGGDDTVRLRFDDWTQGPDLVQAAYDASAEFLSTGRGSDPAVGPVSVSY